MIKPFTIQKQGHIHVEHTTQIGWRPGMRRWYIQTEQKRPDAVGHVDGRDLLLMLYGTDSVYLREGEDGSTSTNLTATLPPTLPWRQWEIIGGQDKWGFYVTVFTSSWPLPFRLWLRMQWRGRWRRISRRRQRD